MLPGSENFLILKFSLHLPLLIFSSYFLFAISNLPETPLLICFCYLNVIKCYRILMIYQYLLHNIASPRHWFLKIIGSIMCCLKFL